MRRMIVVKRDGTRDEFDRAKILRGMETACQKRPVSNATLLEAACRIERELLDRLDLEVTTSEIGECVMRELLAIDQVALVRFASVYLEFESPTEFREIVSRLKKGGQNSKIIATKRPEVLVN